MWGPQIKKFKFAIITVIFLAGCSYNTPAQKVRKYSFSIDYLKNKIEVDCPCSYLNYWDADPKYDSFRRGFERAYSRSLLGRIEFEFHYHEELYKNMPKSYSDNLKIREKAWEKPDEGPAGIRKYYDTSIKPLYAGSDSQCLYIEYGESRHDKARDKEGRLLTGSHSRKLSCPIRETHFRDGLYIFYSLTVLPGYKEGVLSPNQAMADIEWTAEQIAKNLEFSLKQKAIDKKEIKRMREKSWWEKAIGVGH